MFKKNININFCEYSIVLTFMSGVVTNIDSCIFEDKGNSSFFLFNYLFYLVKKNIKENRF